jgi:hypothetical protein
LREANCLLAIAERALQRGGALLAARLDAILETSGSR